MGLKQCDKCSEMVDEAKAFCPDCGNAFEAEETRQEASEFDSLDHTVQLGNTMYNQMLSDMGLNISKSPDPPEKRVEVIAPVPVAVAPLPAVVTPTENTPDIPKAATNIKWIVLGVVVVVFLFLLLLTAVLILFVLWSRFR